MRPATIKLVSLFLAAALTAQAAVPASAGLSDPNNMGNTVKLGLGLSTAMMDEKDTVKGAQKFAKEQFDDWMWESIGGYENLWNGVLEGEATSVQVRKKYKESIEIMDNIGKFAEAVGAGNYDDATFVAIDQAVSKIGHPVVSLLWSSVKFTYESHKQVQATGAELQIEALYGAVDSDRRLRGESSGEDGPKLIKIDSDTVDYFYDKYIITDAGTRALVKSYVTTRLGQEWPEVSWSTWLANIGSGTDTQRSAELEALGGELRNVARGWIRSLLADVNLEAKTRWGQTRVWQQKQEFEKFVKRYKMFGGSMEEMLADFKKLQEYKKESLKYPEFIEKSKTDRTKAESDFAAVKMSQVRARQALRELAEKYTDDCYKYSSRASYLRLFALSNDLDAEWNKWLELRNKITKTFETDSAAVAQEAAMDIKPDSGGMYGDPVGFYNSSFQPLIVPFAWTEEPDAIKQKVLDALNEGDFETARKALDVWAEENAGGISGWDKSPGWPETPNRSSGPRRDHYEKIIPQIIQIVKDDYDSPENWADNGLGGKYFKSCSASLYFTVPGYTYGNTGILSTCKAMEAAQMAAAALSAQSMQQDAVYGGTIKWCSDAITAFDQLRTARWKHYLELTAEMNRLGAAMDFPASPNYEQWSGINFIDSYEPMDEVFRELPGMTITLGGLPDTLRWRKKYHIESTADALVGVMDSYDSMIKEYTGGLGKAVGEWREFWEKNKPPQDDMDQIYVFCNSNFDREYPDRLNELAPRAEAEMSRANTQRAEYLRRARTYQANLDNDSAFLADRIKELDGIIRAVKDTGLVTFDEKGEPSLGSGRGQGGMMYLSKPYPHYLSREELDRVRSSSGLSGITGSNAYKFLGTHFPDMQEQLRRILTFDGITPAREDNFVQPVSGAPIWKSSLEKARTLLAKVKAGGSHKDYHEPMKEIGELLPGTLKTSANNEYLFDMTDVRDESLSFPLGQEYVAIRKDLSKLVKDRFEYLYLGGDGSVGQPSDPRYQRLALLMQNVKTDTANVRAMSSPTQEALDTFSGRMEGYRHDYLNNVRLESSTFDDALSALQLAIAEARSRVAPAIDLNMEKVRDLYDGFREAYESRDGSRVMSFIGDEWEAGDGTTLSDLERNLSGTFGMFDEVRFTISGLNTQTMPDGGYVVNYDVTIRSRSYENDITREEKSSVSEKVEVGPDGRARITKTLTGRFWYVE
ncbi:MAG: hypothetical protein HZA22_00110 [Nitrospirae bacterium]|nr:hypothetical protein [Nitrospirota bacterium]